LLYLNINSHGEPGVKQGMGGKSKKENTSADFREERGFCKNILRNENKILGKKKGEKRSRATHRGGE